jgi:hypothetical protein
VEIDLPMTVRRVAAHDSVAVDRGRVALQRGPIVYCVEWPETDDGHVRNLQIGDGAELTARTDPDLFDGVTVIDGEASAFYRAEDGTMGIISPSQFTAIPYYAWAHRGRGEMAVWLAREADAVRPAAPPTIASRSRVTVSFGQNRGAVNDQLEPSNSDDHEVPYWHWWPHEGTTEWIEYTFEEPAEISATEVYWFDDTASRGGCRLPASWRLLYLDGDDWRPVRTGGTWGVEIDAWNRVEFETVRTNAVRLEIVSQENWAGGIHEWRIR